ncbi:MAG: putative toxin-antitoxin system toxin component, PIN family [Chloroflexi bacterium]|nr:putative toxin-antitoxin system toxin component, PIN family [Chloroflexota bacterium]
MLRVVIDTNLWVRALLGGRVTLPVLQAWQQGKFEIAISEELLSELDEVWQRPRLRERIIDRDARELLQQLRQRGVLVELVTIPPQCRDPRDNPVLATAIDGHAQAIVSGDADLRADDDLRRAMAEHRVQIWGVEMLLQRITSPQGQSMH